MAETQEPQNLPKPPPADEPSAPDEVPASAWKILRPALLSPLIALLFYLAAPYWLNHRLRNEVYAAQANTPDKTDADREVLRRRLAKVDFARICCEPAPKNAELRASLEKSGVCGRVRRFRLGAWLSGGMLALTGVMLVVLGSLNRAASKSRDALIVNFGRAWSIAMAAALIEVLVLTPVLAYGAYELTVLLMDRFFPKLIFLIVVGGLYAIGKTAVILLKSVPLEFDEPVSREVSQAEAPELWAVVAEASARLGAQPPDRIIVGMQPNFYVTELAVKHGGGRATGRTLFLSYPLLKQLSPTDVTAIIGHELGHFLGEDTRLTRDFYPMRFKVAATLGALSQSGWAASSSLHLLALFSWTFERTESAVSRERELLADSKAAELTSADAAARALIRVHVMSDALGRRIGDAVRAKESLPLDARLNAYVRDHLGGDPAFWTKLFDDKQSHPLDSHPALKVRLGALGFPAEPARAIEVAAEETPSAWDAWLSGKDELFAIIRGEFESVFAKWTVNEAAAKADPATEEGKELLERHFPEVVWRAGRGHLILIGVIAIVLGVILFTSAAFIDPPASKVFFFIGVVVVAGIGAYWTMMRRSRVTLRADGVTYTNWNRPLAFSDVAALQFASSLGDEITVTFVLKEKQPSFARFLRPPWRHRTVTLSLGRFAGKSKEKAETLNRFFHRTVG
jgi:Zn-dependent protease with chaperone function